MSEKFDWSPVAAPGSTELQSQSPLLCMGYSLGFNTNFVNTSFCAVNVVCNPWLPGSIQVCDMVFGWLFLGCHNENCRNYVHVLVPVGDTDL